MGGGPDAALPEELRVLPAEKPKQRLITIRAIGNALVKTTVRPLISLKSTAINRDTGAKLLGFAIKVVALEIIRKRTQNRYPHIWAAIQSLPMFQVPPFSWLQRWAPFNYLMIGSQIFSKPIVFLSIATAITEKLDEVRSTQEPPTTGIQTSEDQPIYNHGAIVPAGLSTGNGERREVTVEASEYSPDCITLLKEDLEESGVIIPERIGDDELRRFFVAANYNVKRCVSLVRRHIKWRETFYFLSSHDLENWSSLVFWHGYDARMRPALVVRIGWAYSILKVNERPRFVQAVLSQVEYGMTHLLCEDDPRITVIIDCEGAPAFGFPVNMLKSCCIRVQENYPTRLAALFVVNLHPVVRTIAQAVIQMLRPSTRRKIRIGGENFSNALAEHYGGSDSMPHFLGGNCCCSKCNQDMSIPRSARLRLITREGHESDDGSDMDVSRDDAFFTYNRYNAMLRAVIIGFLMLWVVISLLAGFFHPEDQYIPT